MRLIGRIIMLVVAIGLFASNIPVLLQHIDLLNQAGWGDFSSYPDKFSALIGIISNGFWCLLGLFAVIAAIRGNIGFLTFILCIVGIGIMVWFFVQGFQSGQFTGFNDILPYIPSMIFPFLYFVGGVILKLSPKK